MTQIDILNHRELPHDVNLYLIVAAGLSDALAAYRGKFGVEPARIWRKGTMWWCEVANATQSKIQRASS